MKNAFATFAATTMLATTLSAQGIADWDADADGMLGEAEFAEGLDASGLFDRWDADSDATVDRGEVLQGIYDLWDRDGDGRLSVDEWDDSVDLWYGEDAVNLAVDEWDADGDGFIGEFEFVEEMNDTDLLARLGLAVDDDPLTEEEFSTGVFGLADAGDDDFLGEEEDAWFVDFLELLNVPGDAADPAGGETDVVEDDVIEDDMPDLIPDGEAFSRLPIPCGEDGTTCEETAARFCAVLDYEPPLDFLEVDGSLYVVRCAENF
ncbi:hypothetical protein [Jannaschia formosa]|uniref:hypothetical protein n=1 Tax=Jannaschia formosa TaxID=2259592 RepID=UPI000E1B67EA|nr:hypothetical protein [Jannaschia formosa]TFL16006.1 hypothetical protein DR046_22290 [Jannaschia formosa]